ncbi:hypothetical protein FVEG_15221 [Fusarium verticillioides 7600]|uniref:Uncharacterized protein n=1 Tax=Gibberella moniliformis (strain M3125 / FGSC 7600) TaxID=334819 RepID=W7LNT5_GIBM7|nr:hypothetical protein FVEG_15221 [Fusarium verticillioides 7600]XP_018747249.1 hypothetical protein FVEG_15221 [Fusarium verticillioides 7600]EWG41057.1 hypothetical protein FVEG_15221 [Fusarium verticillioides 7600]EWG41058.1 hypothetical protein FVEG_15221 [Fusarium verticillioides 7600]
MTFNHAWPCSSYFQGRLCQKSVPCPALPPGPKPEVRSQEHPHKLKSSGMLSQGGRGDHDPLTTARHGLSFRNQQWGAFVVPRLHPFREEGERGRRATLPEII